MSILKIGNDFFDITINTKGAEMISLKTNGVERLHQSGPEWEDHAPVLFPFCGRSRDKKYCADGVFYPMKIHGFAMDSEFEVVCSENEKAVFKLKSNEQTRKIYPFDFDFYVSYELSKDTIDVRYKTVNTGNDKMYFSVGSHEGYLCPEGLDEYEIHFEKAEPKTPVIQSRDVAPENLGVADGHSVLKLSEALFEGDITVIYENPESGYVYLINKNTGKKAKVEFSDFDHLLVWAVPFNGYVCIEPWSKLPDRVDSSYELKEKDGIFCLDSGEEHEMKHVITLY